MKPLLIAALLTVLAQGEGSHRIAGRIRIERTAAGTMHFGPAEIVAWAGDQIHWYNDTAEAHEPGVLRKDGTFVAFLEEPVAAGVASGVFSPLARIAGKDNGQIAFTIHYVCGLHRSEHGSIQVIPTP